MTDTKLSDEFYKQVESFFDAALNARMEALVSSRRFVLTEISFRTPDHPHILQKMSHEEPCDYFPEGAALVDRIDRLMKVCGAIGIMTAAQADMANKKLGRISEQIKAFRDRYPDESVQDLLFLPESRDDYWDEAEALPLEKSRKFLLNMSIDSQHIIEGVTISWRKPDEGALKKSLPFGVPKPY